MNKPPENIRDRQLQERIDRRFNIFPDESLQKVIEKLSQHQVQTLTHIREEQSASRKLIRHYQQSSSPPPSQAL